MSESDHKFRRSFINRSEVPEEESAEQQKKKGQELCSGFSWQEDLEEDDTGDKPPVQFSQGDVTNCCQKIATCVMEGVAVDTLRDINMGKMYFEVPLSRDFHLVLAERFNGVWSLDSRLEMIDELRSELSSHFEKEAYQSELNQRIQKVIPDARRSCMLDAVYLNDDTVVMQDGDSPFSVEISLRFDANI